MKNTKELISYLVFGVLTTAINIVSYAFLTKIVHMDYLIANTIAWVLSIIFAFVTNKLYVFNQRETKGILKEFLSFLFFRSLSYILDILMMIALVELLRADDLLAKIVTNIFVILFNYVASKYIIFKRQNG
ncbi:GtrA family protein [Bacillus manliponensis]|uniref:GtrA family protein n=1 Tax=Bacillus manliponensis TaxID=574376 RepID=UPI00351906CE